MNRNTFIFIIILAIISAIIAGVNIANRLNPLELPTPTPIASISPTPSATALMETNDRKQLLTYDNPYCGISLVFDTGVLEFREEASNSATFISMTDPNDMIVLGCQKDIPRPALAPSDIEARTIASVAATLYHDSSAKDGTKIDAIIFTHPKNKLDIYLAGYGKTFEELLTTLKIK